MVGGRCICGELVIWNKAPECRAGRKMHCSVLTRVPRCAAPRRGCAGEGWAWRIYARCCVCCHLDYKLLIRWLGIYEPSSWLLPLHPRLAWCFIVCHCYTGYSYTVNTLCCGFHMTSGKIAVFPFSGYHSFFEVVAICSEIVWNAKACAICCARSYDDYTYSKLHTLHPSLAWCFIVRYCYADYDYTYSRNNRPRRSGVVFWWCNLRAWTTHSPVLPG